MKIIKVLLIFIIVMTSIICFSVEFIGKPWVKYSFASGVIGFNESVSTSIMNIGIGLPAPYGLGIGTSIIQASDLHYYDYYASIFPITLYYIPLNFAVKENSFISLLLRIDYSNWSKNGYFCNTAIELDYCLNKYISFYGQIGKHDYSQGTDRSNFATETFVSAGISIGSFYFFGDKKHIEKKPVWEKPIAKKENNNLEEKKIIPYPEKSEIPTQKYPPLIEITDITFYDRGNNDSILDAEEKGVIEITVKNRGKGDANDLEMYLTPIENYRNITVSTEYKIKEIKCNSIKKIVIPVSSDEFIKTQKVRYRIDVKEQYFGNDADAKIVSFMTKEMTPPQLSLGSYGIDDDENGESMGNSNGKIDLGEIIETELLIQNKGYGEALDVKLKYSPTGTENIQVFIDNNIKIGNLKPGEWKKIVIPILFNKRVKDSLFVFNFEVTEKRERFNIKDSVKLVFNRKISKVDTINLEKVIAKNDREFIENELPILNVDIDQNIPMTKAVNKSAIAVIISAYDYENAPKVDYAKRDGVIMKEYLLKTFGFSEENVFVLVDPTKSDFEKMFGIRNNEKGQLYRCVKPNESDVFIFYTGHGAPDLKTKEAYLVPVEADPSYIELQGFPLSLLYENLNKLPAKSIITVLDACFSGGYDKGMIVKSASPMILGTIDEKIKLNDNITVITSSKGDEVSSWYPDMKHGLFTYYFLKGIKGDADKNGNREITLKELKDYVVEEVSYRAMRLHNRIQTPVFKGDDNKVIVKVK